MLVLVIIWLAGIAVGVAGTYLLSTDGVPRPTLKHWLLVAAWPIILPLTIIGLFRKDS